MININNGSLRINDIFIYQGMKMEDIVSTNIDKIIEDGRFIYYWIKIQRYRGIEVSITLKFFNDIIMEIDLMPLLGDEEVFWDNWTEEREIRRLNIYKNFIEKETGKQLENGIQKYEWGNVYAFYDSKSARVFAGLNYNKGN